MKYLDTKKFLYDNFNFELQPLNVILTILQIVLIAWLLYQVYLRFHGTQAERVFKGLLSITPIILICYAFKLKILTTILEQISQIVVIALIVIFAPEFRRILMQLGGDFNLLNIGKADSIKNTHTDNDAMAIKEANKEIVDAIKILRSKRTGALIIVDKSKSDRFYVNPGYRINAIVSEEILVTIFADKSPLHDGAVIIRGSSIAQAGVILPMTENPKLNWQYGTRHRAAIGFSELTDALCFVVSEETGDVSLARNGALKRFNSLAGVEKELFGYYSHLFKSQTKNKNKLFHVIRDFLIPEKNSLKDLKKRQLDIKKNAQQKD